MLRALNNRAGELRGFARDESDPVDTEQYKSEDKTATRSLYATLADAWRRQVFWLRGIIKDTLKVYSAPQFHEVHTQLNQQMIAYDIFIHSFIHSHDDFQTFLDIFLLRLTYTHLHIKTTMNFDILRLNNVKFRRNSLRLLT